MDSTSVIDRFSGRFPAHVMRRLRTPDGLYRYLHVSPGVERSFGLNPAALLAASGVAHEWIHEIDRGRFIAALERSAAELTTLDEEVRLVLPDGAIRWVRSLGDPRRMADGSVIWDGVALDVTDRREAMSMVSRAMETARRAEVHASATSTQMFVDVAAQVSRLRKTLGFAGNPVDIATAHAVLTELEAILGIEAPPGQQPQQNRLTRRQAELVKLVADGFSNREIAMRLSLKEGTVKLHVSAVLKKLNLRNRTELARAVAMGCFG